MHERKEQILSGPPHCPFQISYFPGDEPQEERYIFLIIYTKGCGPGNHLKKFIDIISEQKRSGEN